MNTIPIKKGLPCPSCDRNTMEVRMLDRMAGRTGFLANSCIDCGYLHSYQITVPRPWWHWALFVGWIPIAAYTIWSLV